LKTFVWILAVLAGLALVGLRQVAHSGWGWAPLHDTRDVELEEMEVRTPEAVQFRYGRSSGSGRAMVARLLPGPSASDKAPNIGGVDTIRLDRDVRLRIDGVDMAVDHHVENPVIVVEFPYPPVPVEAGAHWRAPGEGQRRLREEEHERLSRQWNPSWAELFAEWSLGRGEHEVWLGRAAIRDARYCASVEEHAARGARLCVMHVTNHAGEPVSVRFPLDEPVEWRLEMLGICRFGGRVRRWHNPLLQAWFGRVEYADAGCAPYVPRQP